MTKLALVILHFSQLDLTEACLASVKQLETKGFELEVIVVNNNPLEEIDSLKKKFPGFVFLKTPKNLGYAGGNNFGIKRALKDNTDFILLLNNDTLLDKKIILELLKAAKNNQQVGILGPKIYFAPGHEFHQKRYQEKDKGKVIWYAGGLLDWQNIIASHQGVDEVDQGQYDHLKDTDFVSGCAMLIKKEVFKKIGLFDEDYFLYLEDVDFCWRTKQTGYKILFVPLAKVWHVNAGSSEIGGPLHDYYLTRNRMLFGSKYASLRTKLALIRESLRILFKGSSWQKKGIKDFYLRRFNQAGFKF
jgi:GT2 family glycosyltransferase